MVTSKEYACPSLGPRTIFNAIYLQANILVTSTGHACIADFGMAKAKESEVFCNTNTSNAVSGGTLRWKAPELITDEDDVSSNTLASDIYSFACVLYEVCFPHYGHTYNELKTYT